MAALLAIAAFVFLHDDPSFALSDSLLIEESNFGEFQAAACITVSPQKWVYVLDRENHLVHLFRDPSTPSRSVGGYGWTLTSFDQPSGVAADGLSVYVSDYGNHRVVRFDRLLNVVSSFSTRDTLEADLRFGYPTGVALSRQGDLFILDSDNLRVIKFSRDTRFERVFGHKE